MVGIRVWDVRYSEKVWMEGAWNLCWAVCGCFRLVVQDRVRV